MRRTVAIIVGVPLLVGASGPAVFLPRGCRWIGAG
jgi:hypothetical protein